MSAGYTFTWKGDEFKKELRGNVKKYLMAVGEIYQNSMVDEAPIKTGLLKNSITYFLNTGERGAFKSFGSARATDSNLFDRPSEQNTVRIGSGVIYAASTEYRFNKTAGWMKRAIDMVTRAGQLQELARRMFAK